MRSVIKGLALVLFLAVASRTSWAQAVSSFNRISQPGFGDRQNSYAWSMAWFKGKLYVGTNRNFFCVTLATLDHYQPNQGWYSQRPDPCVSCTTDKYDLDLRAEIWCFNPQNTSWTRIYQAPANVPNPRSTGKFVARDIGYRNMMVYTEADGTEALYVAGVSARDHLGFDLPAPRLLRSTDGVNFAEVPLSLPEIPGQGIVGFRAMVQYNGKMYLTASRGLLGEGALLESADPRTGVFRVVTPPGVLVYELAVYNGWLYLGLGDTTFGYSVWRTQATGDVPYGLIPVVLLGGGRGPLLVSVVSMQVYNDRLYVGSNGWGGIPFPQFSELIRINPDNTWDVVIGNRRFYLFELRQKYPLSGIPDGFGNPFTAHIWRMAEHKGILYAGTNDASWQMRQWIGWIPGISAEYGFDLWASPDGVHWMPYTRNGFSKGSNFGLRTLESTPVGLFAGSADDCEGGEIFLGQAPAGASASSARLMAEQRAGGGILSWDSVPGATKYQVFRSVPTRVRMPAFVDAPPTFREVARPGPFTLVATTSRPYYRDPDATEGGTSLYYMRAVDRRGQVTGPSNLAVLSPHAAPPVTIDQLDEALTKLPRSDDEPDDSVGEFLALKEKARAALDRGDLDDAAQTLGKLRGLLVEDPDDTLDPLAAEVAEDVVNSLIRRINLAREKVLTPEDLTGSGKP